MTKQLYSPEAGALNDLLNLVNNPAIPGREATRTEDKVAGTAHNAGAAAAAKAATAEGTTGVNSNPTLQPVPRPVTATDVMKTEPREVPRVGKLFFTGRLGSGKDFAAAAADAKVFGFADPLYAIAEYFFGVPVSSTTGKDLPGMWAFLQSVGQWGRSVVNDKYPVTPERGVLSHIIRQRGAKLPFGKAFPEVAWDTFGVNNNIWLDSCIARAEAFLKENPGKRVAITNCRFSHEFKALEARGFQHWHCTLSGKTWAARLSAMKLTPESPQVKDLSEQLALQLDQNVIK